MSSPVILTPKKDSLVFSPTWFCHPVPLVGQQLAALDSCAVDVSPCPWSQTRIRRRRGWLAAIGQLYMIFIAAFTEDDQLGFFFLARPDSGFHALFLSHPLWAWRFQPVAKLLEVFQLLRSMLFTAIL